MKLSDIGEFGLINRFAPLFLKNLPDNITGIGDDCAVLPLSDIESLLVTTDMLIQDSHFIFARIPPEELGYKSLAVNLSDIAAMGGVPTCAFLSLGIPPDVEVEWLDRFFAGLNRLGSETNTVLLGGDTTKSLRHLIINIAVLGRAETALLKYRTKAKAGDIVCLTGNIGDSGTGLKLLLDDKPLDEDAKFLVSRHHLPRPHLAEGAWLARQESVHAMIDVSDGIDSDLQRIIESSNCGIKVNLEDLPISEIMNRVCTAYDWNAREIAATGGEDYCLLCTIDPEYIVSVAPAYQKRFKRELYQIGNVTSSVGNLEYFSRNEKVQLTKHGFDHFI